MWLKLSGLATLLLHRIQKLKKKKMNHKTIQYVREKIGKRKEKERGKRKKVEGKKKKMGSKRGMVGKECER